MFLVPHSLAVVFCSQCIMESEGINSLHYTQSQEQFLILEEGAHSAGPQGCTPGQPVKPPARALSMHISQTARILCIVELCLMYPTLFTGLLNMAYLILRHPLTVLYDCILYSHHYIPYTLDTLWMYLLYQQNKKKT